MRISIFLVGILILSSLANAQTQQINIGITPDSPLFFIDKMLKNFQLAISSDATKVRLRADILNERIYEMQYIAGTKPKFTGKALAEIKKGTDELAKEADLKPKSFKIAIEQNLKNSKIVLEGIMERFENDNNTNNDNAIDGLRIAIENQEKRIEEIEDSKDKNEIYIKIKGDIAEVKAVINNQEIRYKVATADVNEVLKDISARNGISINTIKNAYVKVNDQKVKVEVEDDIKLINFKVTNSNGNH